MITTRTIRGRMTYWLGDRQLPRWSSVGDCIYKKDLAHWYERKLLDAIYRAVGTCYTASVAEELCEIDFSMRVQDEIRRAKAKEKEGVSAAQKGTLVHERIRAELHRMQGGIPDHHVPELSDAQLLQFQSAMDWVNKTGFQPKSIEEPVYSESLGVAGTPDAVGLVKGDDRPWVLDWKTGQHYYKSFNAQNCFYQICVQEATGRMTHGAVIQLDGVAEAHEVEPTLELKATVEALVKIYKWLEE